MRCSQYGFYGQDGLQKCNDKELKLGRADNVFRAGSTKFFSFSDWPMVAGHGPGPYPIRDPSPQSSSGKV